MEMTAMSKIPPTLATQMATSAVNLDTENAHSHCHRHIWPGDHVPLTMSSTHNVSHPYHPHPVSLTVSAAPSFSSRAIFPPLLSDLSDSRPWYSKRMPRWLPTWHFSQQWYVPTAFSKSVLCTFEYFSDQKSEAVEVVGIFEYGHSN
jgi:hypothetical protein